MEEAGKNAVFGSRRIATIIRNTRTSSRETRRAKNFSARKRRIRFTGNVKRQVQSQSCQSDILSVSKYEAIKIRRSVIQDSVYSRGIAYKMHLKIAAPSLILRSVHVAK